MKTFVSYSSLACGILGVFPLPFLRGIAAVILAKIAKSESMQNRPTEHQLSIADIGEKIGWISLAVSLFIVAFPGMR
jgi:hypothetical protein